MCNKIYLKKWPYRRHRHRHRHWCRRNIRLFLFSLVLILGGHGGCVVCQCVTKFESFHSLDPSVFVAHDRRFLVYYSDIRSQLIRFICVVNTCAYGHSQFTETGIGYVRTWHCVETNGFRCDLFVANRRKDTRPAMSRIILFIVLLLHSILLYTDYTGSGVSAVNASSKPKETNFFASSSRYFQFEKGKLIEFCLTLETHTDTHGHTNAIISGTNIALHKPSDA